VEEVCDIAARRTMKGLLAAEVEQCFSNKEVSGLDGTRLYDDCITELCHSCSSQDDLSSCKPSVTLSKFKSECVQNGVTRPFRTLDFAQAVSDGRVTLNMQV
jgi:hypothetical protein